MSDHPSSKPSFSPRDRWSIGFQVVLTTLIVLAVVAMLNYLSREYSVRHHLARSARIELSSRTQNVLKSLTNEIRVTIYFDKQDSLYSDIADLLNEYCLANPRITVQTVDYLRDPGTAQKIKTQYELTAATEKNLVIFDAGAKRRVIQGEGIAQYVREQVMGEKGPEFVRKPVAFLGELAFTGALLDVTNPKPFNAYFLHGHGEHSVSSGDQSGYMKFASVLQQNYIRVEPLSLLGTNVIPMDCNLLVIAGPMRSLPDSELEKVDQYLSQGGRLLALLTSQSLDKETGKDRTGLEAILAKWGILVGNAFVQDPQNTIRGWDLIVTDFNLQHPLVNPLLNLGLYMVQPRPVAKAPVGLQAASGARVDELAFTGAKAVLSPGGATGRFPVMVAVEKGAIQGVIAERGATRIIVVGDSVFLANGWIESAANRDFAGYAANWLLDRAQLLKGVGPRPVNEYRLVMTRSQLQAAEWILLAGLPGGILVIGGLVWLRRRR